MFSTSCVITQLQWDFASTVSHSWPLPDGASHSRTKPQCTCIWQKPGAVKAFSLKSCLYYTS